MQHCRFLGLESYLLIPTETLCGDGRLRLSAKRQMARRLLIFTRCMRLPSLHRIIKLTIRGKAIKHESSAYMIEADFESLKAVYGVSPSLSLKPYFWGRYKLEPECCFLLAEFREVGRQPPEPVRFTARLAEMHRNSVSPTGKFGFHMKTMAGPIQQHNDGWSDSWQEIFSNLLGHLLDEDTRRNPPCPEIEVVKHLTKAVVIPRLLRPLQSDGRTIKPCLVHGDLWDGNTATDMETGEPFIFDGKSFYAHNEYETGNWRAPRHRLSSRTYIRQYQKNFPVSEPGN